MGARWTPEETERFRQLYPITPKAELLAAFPGRNFPGMRERARQLGLVRTGGASFVRRNPLRRQLSGAELAYIAGIVDGEGHITFIRSKRGPHVLWTPRVGISNQSEELILWLDERIAWTLRSLKVDKTGWGWAYRPALVGHSSAVLLKALLPYLVIKGDRAMLVIRFCEMRAAMTPGAPVTEEQLAVVHSARALNAKRAAPLSALELSSPSV